MLRGASFVAAVGFLGSAVALAQTAPDFEKQIAPILQSQCVICHGASAAQGGLRLHTKDAAMKSIVAGSPEASKLFRSIELPVGRAGAMPPGGPPVPAAQRDPGAAKKMLETLAFGDIEIERASDLFNAGGKQYANGSYVIRMQQPFSGWAKTLLERQNYPDLRLYPGGPPKRPYDVTAQTLPLQMGVEVATIDQST